MVEDKETQKPSQLVSANAVFVSSTMSGFVEGLVVQPLDYCKSILQAQMFIHKTNLRTELINTYVQRGFLGFYRGSLAEISSLLPRTCAMMTTYELSRRKIVEMDWFRNNNTTTNGQNLLLISFISGWLSGIPEALVVCPFQVVKLRLIMSEASLYRNSFDCAMQIFNTEGIRALLFTGLSPTLYRNCIWNSVYFASMHQIRSFFIDTNRTIKINEWVLTLFGGFFAGIFATVFNCPFDVLKSRFQSQKIRELSGVMKPGDYYYKYTLLSLFHVLRTEGVRGCYAGFIAKAARMGVGGAVAIMAFESFSALFLWAGFKRDPVINDHTTIINNDDDVSLI